MGVKPDPSFSDAVDWLTTRAKNVRMTVEAARRDSQTGRIGILGGAHNAAWAFNAADGDIDCFVDENPARVGNVFYEKPIIHPRQMVNKDLLLLPYGATAETIARKFASIYEARLVTI